MTQEFDGGGNHYNKYGSRNPIARALMSGFLTNFDALVSRAGAAEVHEIGCGEGKLSQRMARMGMRVRGTDASPRVIEDARREALAAHLDIPFEARDVLSLTPEADGAELVVCCEVLEHVDDPVQTLQRLRRLARNYLIVSVPREPLWRALNMARGSYWSALGNTPGHLQHWSRREFVRFLTREVEVLEVRSPLPWTMALCRTAP